VNDDLETTSQISPAVDERIWRLVGYPLVPGADEGGLLAGESVAVKDLFDVAGFPVGAGNPAFLAEARPAAGHAPALRALIEAGAQVRGIARTDEFAYSITGTNAHYGTAPNPRSPLGLPGGSSSGPAAAVAMGQASIGLGTDTAGSIRVPASYQGLWGLRTTHGAVSRAGLLALAPSFDTVGWITRTPDLLRRVAEVSLPPHLDPLPTGGQYVVCRALLDLAAPTVRAAFAEALAAWKQSGALPAVDEVDLPDPVVTREAFRTVQAAEAWREHGPWITAHPGALGADVAARFAWAATVTPDHEAEARAVLDRVRGQIDQVLADRVLLLPSAPTAPPPRSADAAALDAVRTATITLTCLAAVTGRPALSAPLLEAERAEVGVSLLGPRGSDLGLIGLATTLARAAPHRRLP